MHSSNASRCLAVLGKVSRVGEGGEAEAGGDRRGGRGLFAAEGGRGFYSAFGGV